MEQVIPQAADTPFGTGAPVSLESWQQGGKWFSYEGHAIFCRMAGNGEPLVLLHGFPTSSWDWHRIWPMLAQHYQVLAVDLLGFGFSDKPTDYRYSIEDQADLIQGWIEGLGLPRVHLLAHDYGCSVVQELLARDQEDVLPFSIASICLLNGGLFPEVHRPLLIQKLLSSPFGGLVSRVLNRKTFERNFSRLFGDAGPLSAEDLDNFWQLLIYNNGRGILHQLIQFMEERRCHRNRWVDALCKAPQPKRLISGMADPVSGVAMARRYREMVPDADVVSLRRVGHYPHFESPREVYRAYREFTRTNGG